MTSSPRRADTASCPEFVIPAAFQLLGQTAAGELFAHPDDTRVMSGREEFLVGKKLEALAQ